MDLAVVGDGPGRPTRCRDRGGGEASRLASSGPPLPKVPARDSAYSSRPIKRGKTTGLFSSFCLGTPTGPGAGWGVVIFGVGSTESGPGAGWGVVMFGVGSTESDQLICFIGWPS